MTSMSAPRSVCRAEVEHLLGLGDAADRRSREAAPVARQRAGAERKWARRRADVDEGAVEAQQRQVGVDRQGVPRPW